MERKMKSVGQIYVNVHQERSHLPQICYIPYELMNSLKVDAGNFIQVCVHDEKKIICLCVPCLNMHIQHGYHIICNDAVIHNFISLRNLASKQSYVIQEENMIPLECKFLDKVKVLVVMKSVEMVLLSKKSYSVFLRDIHFLLRKYTFKHDSIIHCSQSLLAKQLGLSYILIKNAYGSQYDFENPNHVGKVIDETVVVITGIESEERQLHLIKDQTLLGGLGNILHILKNLITDPWKYQKKFNAFSIRYPSGVLLIGPPGCGKSSLVKQLCHETGACLIATAQVEFQSLSEEETLSNFSKIARRACTLSEEGPCILFIDEIDSLCRVRNSESKSRELRITAQVLLSLDMCRSYPHLLVMGATNRPFDLDPAVRRSGRLEIEILLNTPTTEERLEIISIYCKDIVSRDHPGLQTVANATPGFVGADIRLLSEKIKQFISENETPLKNDPNQICEVMVNLACSIVPSIHKTLDFVTCKPTPSPVGGLGSVKERLRLLFTRSVEHERFYDLFKTRKPKGVLLYGPRGCGKTRLVSVLAAQKGFTFLSANASHLLSPYVGESEKRISALFHTARLAQPTIIFIDEIDGIFGSRDSSGGGVRVNLLTELLQAIDGADVGATSLQGSGCVKSEVKEFKYDVIVCAATNHPHKLDAALLRPGRFDHVIYVPPPDRLARMEILKLKTNKLRIDQDLLMEVVDSSDGWTGAELENLISQAAIESLIEKGVDTIKTEELAISPEILRRKLINFSPSLSRREIERFQQLESSLGVF